MEVVMSVKRIALSLALAIMIVVAAGIVPSSAQKGGLSQSQQRAIGVCLAQCRKNDNACRNKCMTRAETRGLMDKVKACIAGCRDQVTTPADNIPPGATVPFIGETGPVVETVTRCIAGCLGGASGTP
jgi:hypothetical protein